MKKYKVIVPATTANLGPGYDCLGLALGLYNEAEVVITDNIKNPLQIEVVGEGKDSIEKDKRNIVWKAMKRVFDKYKKGKTVPVRIKLINRIPLASGLGSSAAARLSGILLAYKIIGRKADEDEVLSLGMELEGHPDNIVPALKGGLTAALSKNKKCYYISSRASGNLKFAVVSPDFMLSTKKARMVLKDKYSIKDVVSNIGSAVITAFALSKGENEILGISMNDRIHQPYRKKLVPQMDKVLQSAVKRGAYSGALSGAGPSIIAFCKNSKIANNAAKSMAGVWKKKGISSKSYILKQDTKGARIK